VSGVQTGARARLGRPIQVSAAIHFVGDVAFFGEPLQQRADGGFFQRAIRGRECVAAGRYGAAWIAPDVIHHQLFEFTEPFSYH
jgi:hypothetical protein